MTQPMEAWTLAELLDRTASAEPTPSAGSVAAVSASLAMGLVAMGFEIAAKRLRQGKPLPAEATPEELAALTRQARDLAGALLRHAEDDQAAVRRYLRARRVADPEAARQALVHATEVPLAAVRAMRDGLALVQTALTVAPQPVRADVAAGAALLRGALAAILGGVAANLALLPADETRAALAQEARALEDAE
ncbi:MAG: cyclodeaminase/cyclohydrolase family protein [Armatimonadetes bacterium]|nr:cyclodeaminase/cyclohydrolase family protein [Armatimonadota bacterium]